MKTQSTKSQRQHFACVCVCEIVHACVPVNMGKRRRRARERKRERLQEEIVQLRSVGVLLFIDGASLQSIHPLI